MRKCMVLFTLERQTICAFLLSRTRFMGSYCNAIQRAVILRSCVVCALCYGTFDAFINTHVFNLLLLFNDIMAILAEIMNKNA